MANKKSPINGLVKGVVVTFIAAVVLSYLTKNVSLGIGIAGLAALGLAYFKQYGKKLDMDMDASRYVVGLIGIVLVAGAFAGVANPLTDYFTQGVTTVNNGINANPASVTPTGNQVTPTPTVTTISSLVNFDVLAKNLLNKSDDSLNPTGKYYSNGAYQSLSFSSGKATISNLLPSATIDKISVGTDGTFYWSQQTGLKAINQATTFNLVRVFTAYTFTASAFESTTGVTKYSDVTNGTANISTSTGGTMKFYMNFKVTSQFTGIRHPVFVFSVNQTAVQDVTMPGLSTVTAPTGLLSADTGARSIFKAFDSGFDWMVDTNSKPLGTVISTSPVIYQDATAGKVLYGGTDLEVDVQYKSTVDPYNNDLESCKSAGNAGNAVHVYVVDQDEYYRSNPGVLSFLDPALSSTNLGSTTQPDLMVCPA